MRFGMTTALTAAVMAVTFALPASAKDRRVEVINNTGYTIVEFYGSNTGTTDWEEDILGVDVLPPGDSVLIDFNDGSDYCMFDMKIVFEDGDVLLEEGLDTCTTESFTLE